MSKELKKCECYQRYKPGISIEVDSFNPLVCAKCKGIIFTRRKENDMKLKQCQLCGSDAKLMKESNTHCNCSNKDCLLYGDRYFHIDKWNKRQEVSTPSVDKICSIIEDLRLDVIACLDSRDQNYIDDLFKKAMNNLKTSGKAKEPQWPKKVYTYKSLPSRKDYRTGFNAARDLCKQAWKDEKERTPGIPGKQDKYV